MTDIEKLAEKIAPFVSSIASVNRIAVDEGRVKSLIVQEAKFPIEIQETAKKGSYIYIIYAKDKFTDVEGVAEGLGELDVRVKIQGQSEEDENT